MFCSATWLNPTVLTSFGYRCFWGVEHIYRKHFENKGLLDARVGYIGGDTNHPSYRLVCSGETGRESFAVPYWLCGLELIGLRDGADAEALQVLYDPDKVSYETLIEFFFRMHDPTTLNRQGPDVGSQYRSAIFYHSPEQESSARRIIAAAQKEWFKGQNIATEVIPAGQWWDAEEYHQLYLSNNPGGYECPSQ